MADYIWQGGAVHHTTVTYTPPASYVGLALTFDAYLSADGGATKSYDSGPVPFTAAAGGNTFNVSVTMPTTINNYHLYLVILDGTQVIVGYADTNNLIIGGGGTIVVGPWT